MQWSKIKKQAEELICPDLRDRVQFHLTSYRSDRDKELAPAAGRGRGWITVDGAEVLNLSGGKPGELFESERQDLYLALKEYPGLSLDGALQSENVVTRALAMIDRRLGKRRLQRIDVTAEHPLVRLLHGLRCTVEGVTPAPGTVPERE